MKERKLKRIRKRIFELVSGIAGSCLFSLNDVSRKFPNASKKELYELAIVSAIKKIDGYTDEDIEFILNLAVRRHKSEDLSFLDVVCYIVNLHIPPEYKVLIETPIKSIFSVWGDEPEPSLEESFTSTRRIVESIIPANI